MRHMLAGTSGEKIKKLLDKTYGDLFKGAPLVRHPTWLAHLSVASLDHFE